MHRMNTGLKTKKAQPILLWAAPLSARSAGTSRLHPGGGDWGGGKAPRHRWGLR